MFPLVPTEGQSPRKISCLSCADMSFSKIGHSPTAHLCELLAICLVALQVLGKAAMMAILHIGLALVAAGLVVELFAAATAPLGFQDDGGFHLGQEDDSDSGNPS